MGALELWRDGAGELARLDGPRATIGADASNDLVLDDRAVSGVHAVLDRLGNAWSLRDLGSRNGTFINGERLTGERILDVGDELRFGAIRFVVGGASGPRRLTETLLGSPQLTPRERDVLTELCRPLAEGDAFTEPAAVREIAAKLVVTEAAVKQHLAHLYDKFDLHDAADRRRVKLANAALTRGAVSLGDLR